MARHLLPLAAAAALAAGCAHRSGPPPRAAPEPPEPPEPPSAAAPARSEASPPPAAPGGPPATGARQPSQPPERRGAEPAAPATPDAAREEVAPADRTWLDVGHAFLEQRIFAPVVRFDRFFSDERDVEADRSRSFLRVRGEVRLRDDGPPLLGASVRANLRLPYLAKRLEDLRLVIAGEADDTRDALFPGGGPLQRNPVGRANAELRYGLWDGLLAHADAGAGVLLAFPPGVFGRARLRYAIPVRRILLARLANTGFWRTDTGWGTSLDADLERPLGPASLLRLGSSGELTQKSLGVEWASELALIRSLGQQSAVRVAAGLQGKTRLPTDVERYRVYTRLRRDFYRRWIFFELEPEVAWPWDAAHGRRRELAFTFRLEVQFQGNEPPVAPPPEAPEPADPAP